MSYTLIINLNKLIQTINKFKKDRHIKTNPFADRHTAIMYLQEWEKNPNTPGLKNWLTDKWLESDSEVINIPPPEL